MATHETLSSELLDRLFASADSSGLVTYAQFSRFALFDESFGYYRANRQRVGKDDGTDFYTSVSVGPVFGRLVAAAARNLIPSGKPSDYTLLEIGAEPGVSMFEGVDTGFAEVQCVRLGEPFAPSPRSVFVANEVLDAQPFHRLEFHDGQWREWGIARHGQALVESPLPDFSEPLKAGLVDSLPSEMPEGYRLDLSLEAESLVADWLRPDWRGALVLIDYGKSWRELLEATPQGTARAYSQHQQSNDLLAQPGQQDLTTHVCWNRIEHVLKQQGLQSINLQRQEAFFVHQAWDEIERVASGSGREAQNARGQIQSLIHPAHFGTQFQAMFAKRC